MQTLRSLALGFALTSVACTGSDGPTKPDVTMQPAGQTATIAPAPTAGAATGTAAGAGGVPSTAAAQSAGASGSASSGTAGAGPAGTAAPVPASAGQGAGGAAAPLTPNAADTATIKMDEFVLEPGAEAFMCQDFENPFGGEDVAIVRSESDMTPGSHHLHVYYGANNPPDSTVVPCVNPNEFRPMIHLATVPHQVSEYPAGMAAKLKGTAGIRFQSHYVNTTSEPLRANVIVKLTKADPEAVDKWVAQMHFNRVAMSIPPGTGREITTSCTIPSNFGPIGLVQGISHMHKHGVHFVAKTSTGELLLETNEWDDAPPTNYATPVMINPGESIIWTCTYDNNTDGVLTYGDSAIKNEMCVYIARFFSSPSGDDLECETPFASATARSTRNLAGQ